MKDASIRRVQALWEILNDNGRRTFLQSLKGEAVPVKALAFERKKNLPRRQ
jgi:hypothetical protein